MHAEFCMPSHLASEQVGREHTSTLSKPARAKLVSRCIGDDWFYGVKALRQRAARLVDKLAPSEWLRSRAQALAQAAACLGDWCSARLVAGDLASLNECGDTCDAVMMGMTSYAPLNSVLCDVQGF